MRFCVNHRLVERVCFRVLPRNGGTIPLDVDDAWEATNIVRVRVPQLIGADIGDGKKCDGWIRWHKKGVYQLLEAFKEIEAKGLKHLILSYAGAYYPRMIRGSTQTPSEHSFGLAIDINAAWNGLGVTPPALGQMGSVRALVAIFEKWGFRWGGYFRRKDGMHFEIARWIEPSAAAKPQPTVVQAVKNAARKFFLNGKLLASARYENKRWWVPVREVCEALDYEVQPDLERTDEGAYHVKAWRKK